jgi:hypothetical protein
MYFATRTGDIKHETYESMVGSEWKKNLINKQNVLEVVDHALSIQEVHGSSQKVPVQRLRKAEAPCSTWYIGDRDDFFK